ncbi:uncharacterized protein CcaverHIS019_0212460 [Cutaneotrichosporon cavernicola]|uniref:Brix domain-containing protein n=1 Tax=Cutaneotrichosporon cavernicola TaxID=279322 RepID=A0AA48KYY2_9TREE|nr:uncharacterized protein CcaverHIS019_0212460 [Cutaneotrichosporon cavernicola]BEI89884.1 hypothetical protein CcaverHIS019_0212460 [Cutaneotrichosporon cavernicola]BEI97655.1 hypothetical protein CcaverHIS631_0212440 [Cutaneotrichosporon cavernicola]BEJ05432.1 hypothetical protein CcaverHIS641_0212490 [Cutaneotrichosporon cavernicola]
MGKRRRKNRTHLKGAQASEAEVSAPKSFVIKSGHVTKSVEALVRDVRQVMEPNTATRLRERPGARLRDYLTIAPTLGVTHLMGFTLTDAANLHLRVARLPQGPTLTFRVLRYSLMKDITNARGTLRNIAKSPGGEYRNPPLLVLNGFQQPTDGTALPQLRLVSTMFQGLFPPIQVEKSALPTFRRVLLVSYNHSTGLVSIRHFIISVRPQGVSRRVRKLLNPSKAPDLTRADDIADYLLRRRGSSPGSEGYDSMSESEASEAESDSNAVELPEDYVGRGNRKGERKAVRLLETGPRLELQLVKIVEGLVGSKRGEGQTVFHHFEARSKGQNAAQQRAHDERRRLREARRAEQAANVARKKAEKAKAKGEDEEEEEEESDVDVDGLSDMDPEEALERRRAAAEDDDDEEEDDEDGFDYEDHGADADDDDGWDADALAGDVSDEEEEESSDEDEVRPPPPKRRVKPKH